jgi:hypothetical protein
MPDEKQAEGVAAVTPADDDEEVREFEALLRDIAELRDPDTVVEHMDVEMYRQGKRA